MSSSIGMEDANSSIFSVPLSAGNTFGTINTTNTFNKQYNEIITRLTNQRIAVQQDVNDALAKNPADTSNRQSGVRLARQYEQAEIEMGGKGSSDWTDKQRQEIRDTGTVRGSEGHHINNVADHPEEQGNPDNIRFAKTREEHQEMHGGNFRNKTEGEMIDRDKRLNDTNNNRVIRNELSGLGIAAAIGLGTGFTIGFIVTLAQSGVSPENVRNAAFAGGKAGAEGMAFSLVNHVLTRSIGNIASNALQGFLQNIGLTVTDNISTMCNMGVCGILAITVFSVYQFVRLKNMGFGTKECLIRVGKQAAFSASVLAASIVAQGVWGGAAGLVVSLSIGLVVLTYRISLSIHDRQLLEKIKLYTIEKSYPYFGGFSYAVS
jgi:hypothetical protein